MAVTIAFDGSLLLITASGTLVDADLELIGDEVLAIEDGGTNTPNRLTDLRQVTDTAVGYREMARLVDRGRTRPLHAALRSALVIDQPVQLGYARMFQILNDHPQVTVRIFEDEASARAWLATSDLEDAGRR